MFIAGQVGWNAQQVFESEDIAPQFDQALANLLAVLAEAGGRPEHIVRITWYVTDKREYLAAGKAIGAAFREIIGAYNAAMSAVEVSALMEDMAVLSRFGADGFRQLRPATISRPMRTASASDSAVKSLTPEMRP